MHCSSGITESPRLFEPQPPEGLLQPRGLVHVSVSLLYSVLRPKMQDDVACNTRKWSSLGLEQASLQRMGFLLGNKIFVFKRTESE